LKIQLRPDLPFQIWQNPAPAGLEKKIRYSPTRFVNSGLRRMRIPVHEMSSFHIIYVAAHFQWL